MGAAAGGAPGIAEDARGSRAVGPTEAHADIDRRPLCRENAALPVPAFPARGRSALGSQP